MLKITALRMTEMVDKVPRYYCKIDGRTHFMSLVRLDNGPEIDCFFNSEHIDPSEPHANAPKIRAMSEAILLNEGVPASPVKASIEGLLLALSNMPEIERKGSTQNKTKE